MFGYTVVANGTAHSGPSAALTEGSASGRVLVRVRTDVSVRSEVPSRAVSKSSFAFAPPLCYWSAENNCGLMVLDAGQVRASARFSADASDFIKCHWEIDGLVHEWLSETPVLDFLHVFLALLE